MLDEAKWGLDFLVRMQSPTASVLSIVGEPSASPPSAATGQSLYGPATTSATLATAAAFAAGARILKLPDVAALNTAAADLLTRARNAWTWAVANPNVQFKNNDSASGSAGLGAGQQETDDYGRLAYKLDAAVQLFAATGEATYRTFFDGNYTQLHLFTYSNYVAPWDVRAQDAALDYADATGATAAVVTAIRNAYLDGREEQRQPGRDHRQPGSVPRVHERLHLGLELDQVARRQPVRRRRQPSPRRGVERGHDARGVALRALHPRDEPAVARLPDQHVGARRARTAPTRCSTPGSPTAARCGIAPARRRTARRPAT